MLDLAAQFFAKRHHTRQHMTGRIKTHLTAGTRGRGERSQAGLQQVPGYAFKAHACLAHFCMYVSHTRRSLRMCIYYTPHDSTGSSLQDLCTRSCCACSRANRRSPSQQESLCAWRVSFQDVNKLHQIHDMASYICILHMYTCIHTYIFVHTQASFAASTTRLAP
jgi:hypothetical protein